MPRQHNLKNCLLAQKIDARDGSQDSGYDAKASFTGADLRLRTRPVSTVAFEATEQAMRRKFSEQPHELCLTATFDIARLNAFATHQN